MKGRIVKLYFSYKCKVVLLGSDCYSKDCMRKLLLLPTLSILFLAGCGGGDAIQVGDVSISKDSFNRWVQTNARGISGNNRAPFPLDAPEFKQCIAAKKKAAQPQPPSDQALRKLCESLYIAAQQQTVKTLASQAWVLAEAKKQGIKADPRQVEQQLQSSQQQFKSQPGGVNEEDLRQRAEYIVLVQQLRQKAEKIQGKQPSIAQLQDYYRKHIGQFSSMPSRDILMLVAKDQSQAKAALADLRAGKSWDYVFKRYNDLATWGASKPLQNGATQPSFQPQLRRLLFQAPQGKTVGPYQLSEYKNGWLVFQVKQINPGRNAKPFNQIQGQIKQNFMFAQRAQAADRAINQLQKEWQPQTECDQALQDMYPCKGTKSS